MAAAWAMYSWKYWVKYTCTEPNKTQQIKIIADTFLHTRLTWWNQPASNVNLKTYLKSRLIWGVFPEKLLPWEYYRTHWWCSQHWLRKCLGATMHQAITWINKDQDILVIIHRTWAATKYYQLTANILQNGDKYPADTWHNNNVIITSKRRCDAVLT